MFWKDLFPLSSYKHPSKFLLKIPVALPASLFSDFKLLFLRKMPISRGIFQVKFSFRQANKQGENPSLFGGEKGIIWGKKRNIWWEKKGKIKVDFVMKELIKEIQKKK